MRGIIAIINYPKNVLILMGLWRGRCVGLIFGKLYENGFENGELKFSATAQFNLTLEIRRSWLRLIKMEPQVFRYTYL
jgi:hypothetical protein